MAEYIDRDAAVKAAQDGADEWDGGFNRNRDAYIECAIDNVPAANVRENVKSAWVRCDKHIVKCHKCGNFLDMRGVNAGRGDANFCPNCGAEMTGGNDG